MSNKITKARIKNEDNETLKLVALKLSAEKMKIVTTAEVINGIIKSIERERGKGPDGIIKAIRNEL